MRSRLRETPARGRDAGHGRLAFTVDRGRARTTRLAEAIVEGIFFRLPVEALEAFHHRRIVLALIRFGRRANGMG